MQEALRVLPNERWRYLAVDKWAPFNDTRTASSGDLPPGLGFTHARGGSIVFGDLLGKLNVLRVECAKCGRRSPEHVFY